MNDFREYQAAFLYRQVYISHHGIKGMHWGIRRFQNKDGSLTEEGKRRLGLSNKDAYAEFEKEKKKIDDRATAIGIASLGAGYGGGTLGGLAAGVAAGSAIGPVGALGAYFGVKYGAVLASTILAGLVGEHSIKKIDDIRKSYGEDRIKKMEAQAEKKAKEMTEKMNKEANKAGSKKV